CYADKNLMSIITVLSTKLLGTYERTKPNRPSAGSCCKRQRMVANKLDFDDSASQYSYDACVGIQLKHQSE
ncbi:hypothetical protein ACTHT3_15660, partial [Neisseria sp. P0015.S004]